MAELIMENIVTHEDGNIRVRVWFAREVKFPSHEEHKKQLITAMQDVEWQQDHLQNCRVLVGKLKGVNAIEVQDMKTGQGSLIYPDWP